MQERGASLQPELLATDGASRAAVRSHWVGLDPTSGAGLRARSSRLVAAVNDHRHHHDKPEHSEDGDCHERRHRRTSSHTRHTPFSHGSQRVPAVAGM